MAETSPSHFPITVNKLGGKSVSKREEFLRLMEHLAQSGESPVLVVSAFKDVTDKLVEGLDSLNHLLTTRGSFNISDVDSAFRAARELVKKNVNDYLGSDPNDPHLKNATAWDEKKFQECASALMEHQKTVKSLNPADDTYRVRDIIIGYGEWTIVGILQQVLKREYDSRGYDTEVIDNVTYRGNLGHDRKLSRREFHRGIQEGIKEEIKKVVDKTRQRFYLVSGHVLGTPRGMTVDVGRSYSDATALDTLVALSELFGNISEVRIWKDVAGVMSANPAIVGVTNAILHEIIALIEGLELSSTGDTMMHADALTLAVMFKIKILKLLDINSVKPGQQPTGTTYTPSEDYSNYPFKIIAANMNLAVVSVGSGLMATEPGFVEAISEQIRAEEISIDNIFTEGTKVHITILLPKDDAPKAECMRKLKKLKVDLQTLHINGETYDAEASIDESLSSVSLIGSELSRNGQSGKICEDAMRILRENNIQVKAITSGLHPCKISLVVDRGNEESAVKILHKALIENGKKK